MVTPFPDLDSLAKRWEMLKENARQLPGRLVNKLIAPGGHQSGLLSGLHQDRKNRSANAQE